MSKRNAQRFVRTLVKEQTVRILIAEDKPGVGLVEEQNVIHWIILAQTRSTDALVTRSNTGAIAIILAGVYQFAGPSDTCLSAETIRVEDAFSALSLRTYRQTNGTVFRTITGAVEQTGTACDTGLWLWARRVRRAGSWSLRRTLIIDTNAVALSISGTFGF